MIEACGPQGKDRISAASECRGRDGKVFELATFGALASGGGWAELAAVAVEFIGLWL